MDRLKERRFRTSLFLLALAAAVAVATHVNYPQSVHAEGSLGLSYDSDNRGYIDRDEVLAAILGHFRGELSQDDVLRLVGMHLARTPIKVPSAKEQAAASLSAVIPWFRNPPDSIHEATVDVVSQMWVRHPDLGNAVARLTWVADGMTEDEFQSVTVLGRISAKDTDVALLESCFLSSRDAAVVSPYVDPPNTLRGGTLPA